MLSDIQIIDQNGKRIGRFMAVAESGKYLNARIHDKGGLNTYNMELRDDGEYIIINERWDLREYDPFADENSPDSDLILIVTTVIASEHYAWEFLCGE